MIESIESALVDVGVFCFFFIGFMVWLAYALTKNRKEREVRPINASSIPVIAIDKGINPPVLLGTDGSLMVDGLDQWLSVANSVRLTVGDSNFYRIQDRKSGNTYLIRKVVK